MAQKVRENLVLIANLMNFFSIRTLGKLVMFELAMRADTLPGAPNGSCQAQLVCSKTMLSLPELYSTNEAVDRRG